MTLDYNDSRVKTKTRVIDKDEIDNYNKVVDSVDYIKSKAYNNNNSNSNSNNRYLIFYRCEWDAKYHIDNHKDNNSINKAKDKRNNE